MNKKTIIPIGSAVLILVILVVAFYTISVNSISGEWRIDTIVDGSGNVIACSSEMHENYPNAQVSTMTVEAQDHRIRIMNEGETWNGSYQVNKCNPAGTIYEIEIQADGKVTNGLAVASNKNIFGAQDENVLTINLLDGDQSYSLFLRNNEK